MKTTYLIAMLIAVWALASAPNVLAGAYDTGTGHGYSSCESTEIIPAGTIFRIGRIWRDVYPASGLEIGQLRCAVLLKHVARSVVYDLHGSKLWL